MNLPTNRIFMFVCVLVACGNVHYSQTGILNPFMSSCDVLATGFLSKYQIPGATFALAKNGKLVYLRAFGTADVSGTEITQPYHKFRIASLSKPVTAIAVMKLVEDGVIGLSDRVFGNPGILGNDPDISAGVIADNDIYDITVAHLLEHSAGWDRETGCFPNPTLPYPHQQAKCDPITVPLHIAKVTGGTDPVSEASLMEFMLEKGLDFKPGTGYAYSNIGYLFLGRIIEQVSGDNYETYVRSKVLRPLGICDMELAKNIKSQKSEREAEYTGNGFTTLSCYGDGSWVPWEYGGFNIESMDAHGGWIATASDLVKLLVAVDGFSTKNDMLNAASVSMMVTPSPANPNYAKGWQVNQYNNWWHFGDLDGTAAFMARTGSGYTWAIILNKRVVQSLSSAFFSELDALPWNCLAQATGTPGYDLMLHPTVNAGSLAVVPTNDGLVQLNWTAGNGDRRLVVCSKDHPVNAFPLDGIKYAPGVSVMGSGDSVGMGNYVIYNGSGNSATVGNLDPGSAYYFRVFEYNENAETGNLPLYKLCDCSMGKSGPVTALRESALPGVVNIYPNPTSGDLKIETNENIGSIEVFNSMGEIVLRMDPPAGMKECQVDGSKLSAGLYQVRVSGRDGQTVGTEKVLKD